MWNKWLQVWRMKEYHKVFYGISFFYFFIYLIATLQLIWVEKIQWSFLISDNWMELLFKQRNFLVFEFLGKIEMGNIVFFLSPVSLLIALILSLLVGANVLVTYYSFRKLGLQGGKGLWSLVGTLPAILSGAACCVPTLILVVGLQFTSTLATIWPWLLPVSLLLLFLSLFWSLTKVR